jgi:hypothetical protein
MGLVRKWDSSVVSSSPFSCDFPPFLCARDPFPGWAEHRTEARKEDDEDEEETGDGNEVKGLRWKRVMANAFASI